MSALIIHSETTIKAISQPALAITFYLIFISLLKKFDDECFFIHLSFENMSTKSINRFLKKFLNSAY